MKRFSVLASITATLLLGSVAGHAQSPEIQKFFVFDAHMHPMANAYRGGWNVGDPNDPQFSLSMARQGGLGAVFANTSVDEFYSVNHIAVKEVLRQFDHMYRQVVLYPDQLASYHHFLYNFPPFFLFHIVLRLLFLYYSLNFNFL